MKLQQLYRNVLSVHTGKCSEMLLLRIATSVLRKINEIKPGSLVEWRGEKKAVNPIKW